MSNALTPHLTRMPPVSRTDIMNCDHSSRTALKSRSVFFQLSRFVEIDQTDDSCRGGRAVCARNGDDHGLKEMVGVFDDVLLGFELMVSLRPKWHCVLWRSCFNNQ